MFRSHDSPMGVPTHDLQQVGDLRISSDLIREGKCSLGAANGACLKFASRTFNTCRRGGRPDVAGLALEGEDTIAVTANLALKMS